MIALLVIFKKDTQLKYPHIKVIYHNIFKLFSVLFFPLLPTLVVPQTFVRVKCEKVKFLLRKYLNSVSIFEDYHIFLKILQVCVVMQTLVPTPFIGCYFCVYFQIERKCESVKNNDKNFARLLCHILLIVYFNLCGNINVGVVS